MTEIKFKVGPISGSYKTHNAPLTSLKPCVPAIRPSEKLFRTDVMVSYHADELGNVTATRVWPTEDGRLARI